MTRKSERELERAVDRLDEGGHLPTAGLITLLSTTHAGGTVELLDRERRLVRVDGDVHRADAHSLAQLDESWWVPNSADTDGGA